MSSWSMTVFGLPIKSDIDVGHLLTFLTLTAGFVWWLITTIRAWRRTAREDAESGALRLLLYLLREKQGEPIALSDLQGYFNSPGMKERRKAYCKRNYLLKPDHLFERAIYQLDWEGKIDFVGAHAVAFRVDRQPNEQAPRASLLPTAEDRAEVLRILQHGLDDLKGEAWTLRGTVLAAYAVAPQETASEVRRQLKHPDPAVQRRATELMGEMFKRQW